MTQPRNPAPRLRVSNYRTELKVQLLDSSTGVGTRGQSDATFHTVDRVWAAVETLSGRELEWARQRYPLATLRIETFYNTKIQEAGQLVTVIGDRTFQISAVDNVDERNRTTVAICDEAK